MRTLSANSIDFIVIEWILSKSVEKKEFEQLFQFWNIFTTHKLRNERLRRSTDTMRFAACKMNRFSFLTDIPLTILSRGSIYYIEHPGIYLPIGFHFRLKNSGTGSYILCLYAGTGISSEAIFSRTGHICHEKINITYEEASIIFSNEYSRTGW